MRRKKVKKFSKAAKFLLFVGIAGTVCFATLIANYMIINRQEEAYYASLPVFFAQDDGGQNENIEQPVSLDARIEPKEKIKWPAVDFEAILKEFPNAAAWIRINGTGINYPVMYGADNQYYLTHRPDGKSSRSGSIFIDYRNSSDFSNQNTFIYGHRMRSGAMFGMLSKYGNQSFYDEHPIVSILTPKGNYELQLFAGYVFNQREETQAMKFSNAKSFENYIQNAKRRSIFKSDVKVNYGDLLATLCTCEYSFDDARLFLVGKLVKEN